MFKSICILAASVVQFNVVLSIVRSWFDVGITGGGILIEASFITYCIGFLIACVRFGWDK